MFYRFLVVLKLPFLFEEKIAKRLIELQVKVLVLKYSLLSYKDNPAIFNPIITVLQIRQLDCSNMPHNLVEPTTRTHFQSWLQKTRTCW